MSNTHSCCNWDPVLERHLDGPLHLQDVAEVLADDQVHLVQDQNLKGLSQLVLDFGLDWGSQVERASLGDTPSNDGSPLPSHFLCCVARCLVDFCTRKLAAFGKSIVMRPEGESLGDVCASSGKFNPQLLDGFWVFRSSFWSPRPSGGIAALLQGHDVRPIAKDHLPTR